MKRFLVICLLALTGSLLIACGDDDEDEGTTEPAISIQTPTESETATTPTAPSDEATESAPPGQATETAPSDGGGASAKPQKGKGGPGGGEKADLPKCSEIGEGPAPCRRPDGSVRTPEPL